MGFSSFQIQENRPPEIKIIAPSVGMPFYLMKYRFQMMRMEILNMMKLTPTKCF
jgi:hypothetical protein